MNSLGTTLNQVFRQQGLAEYAEADRSGTLATLIQVYDPAMRRKIVSSVQSLGLRVSAVNATTLKAEDQSAFEDEIVTDLKAKVKQWRKHTQQNATGAGWRKANRKTDPRIFARQLAQLVSSQAKRHGSSALMGLARTLNRAASDKDPKLATEVLNKLAAPERQNPYGPSIQKPKTLPEQQRPTFPTQKPQQLQPPPQQGQFRNNSGSAQMDPDPESPVNPSGFTRPSTDRSWESEASRLARHVAPELAHLARSFLEDYQSTNSTSTNSQELLQQPELFEAWVSDLEDKGLDPDPSALEQAWTDALKDMTGDDSPDLNPDNPPSHHGLEAPFASRHSAPVKQYLRKNMREDDTHAPGGDWANQIMNSDSDPHMDKWMKAIGKKFAGKAELKHAVDQCLDHFSGEMLPGEISPEDVKNFVEQEFPDVSGDKVYEVIQELADPKRRHDDDPDKDEEDDEDDKKRYNQATKKSSRLACPCDEEQPQASPFEDALVSSKNNKLRGQKEICSSCAGRGHDCHGSCLGCGGSGRQLTDPHTPNAAKKAAIIAHLGSLLLVSVDGQRLSSSQKRDLSRLTGSRVANRHQDFVHSPALMDHLLSRDIPYRTISYCHPLYQRKASSPQEPGFLSDTEYADLPYSIRATLAILDMKEDKNQLSPDQLVSAIKRHAHVIEDQLGRSPTDLIREINDFEVNGPVQSSRKIMTRQQHQSYLKKRQAIRQERIAVKMACPKATPSQLEALKLIDPNEESETSPTSSKQNPHFRSDTGDPEAAEHFPVYMVPRERGVPANTSFKKRKS
jgi:hypothetical protein